MPRWNDGGGEAGQVGDHPSAHGHHHVRPADPGPGEPTAQLLHHGQRLGPLAVGNLERHAGSPGSTSTPIPAWVTTTARRAAGTASATCPASSWRAPAPTITSIARRSRARRGRLHRRPVHRCADAPRSPDAAVRPASDTCSTTSPALSSSTSTTTSATCVVERPAHRVQVDQRRRPGPRPAAAVRHRRPPAGPAVAGSARSHTTMPDRASSVPVGRGQHHPAGRRHHHRVRSRPGPRPAPGTPRPGRPPRPARRTARARCGRWPPSPGRRSRSSPIRAGRPASGPPWSFPPPSSRPG